MRRILEDLTKLEYIDAVVVLRRDGILIDSILPDKGDPRRLAAMTAAIVGTSEIAAEVLKFGRFYRSIIESVDGKILSLNAGPEVVLSTLVTKGCNLGFVLLALEKAGRKLERELARGVRIRSTQHRRQRIGVGGGFV